MCLAKSGERDGFRQHSVMSMDAMSNGIKKG
jgi:hypothetical protein